ncbi:MAG: hypothetical protein JSW71_19775 [Gemmatimonadota bacterium]|nr:MAG: hypothetical protein JSW71_19775 [Gemmatimonadota bacterium]
MMNSYRFARLSWILVSELIAVTLSGCRREDGTGLYSIADSAGVEIVTNHSPMWSEADAWSVDPDPALSIGAVAGDPAHELYRVTGAVRLSDGTIAVLSSGSHELRLYDPAGRHLRSVGGEGEGPGKFQSPLGLYSLAGDTVVVWDARQRRVSFFDRAGEYVRSFTLPPGNNLWQVQDLFDDRTLLATATIRSASGDESGPRRAENLYAVFDLEGDSIATLGLFPDGDQYSGSSQGWVVLVAQVFGRTTHVAAHGTALYVGTNDANAIDQYVNQPVGLPDGGETVLAYGRLVRSIRRDTVVPVTAAMFAAERDAQLDAREEGIRELYEPVMAEMPQPGTLPYYSAIETDADANVWVRHYSCRTMPSFEWTVFDPQGRMLGDVMLPERFDVYEIGGDYVLGRWRDEANVEYVHLHRLSK